MDAKVVLHLNFVWLFFLFERSPWQVQTGALSKTLLKQPNSCSSNFGFGAVERKKRGTIVFLFVSFLTFSWYFQRFRWKKKDRNEA